jgi:hypothetical protein
MTIIYDFRRGMCTNIVPLTGINKFPLSQEMERRILLPCNAFPLHHLYIIVLNI